MCRNSIEKLGPKCGKNGSGRWRLLDMRIRSKHSDHILISIFVQTLLKNEFNEIVSHKMNVLLCFSFKENNDVF